VEKHTVSLPEEVADTDIEAASNFMQQHFADYTAGQLLSGGVALPESGRPSVDALVEACREALVGVDETAAASDQVFVGGAARMAERFDAVDQVRAVLGILEQSFVVVSLLRDVLAQGQSVAIGSEHGVATLAECSLVVAPYAGEDDTMGTIGILGPTRMDYPQALAAVAVVGQRLSRELQRG
jgi:heat-inducible transcriptional repressor